MGKHHIPLIEKLYTKVLIGDDCWMWTAGTNGSGYAQIWWEGKTEYAYRIIYEYFVGPIPEGHDLDHECHNEAARAGLCDGGPECQHGLCVRPDHLKPKPREGNLGASPLTQSSINKAKTHCKRDHEFTEENTRLRDGKYRSCRACEKMTKDERDAWDSANNSISFV